MRLEQEELLSQRHGLQRGGALHDLAIQADFVGLWVNLDLRGGRVVLQVLLRDVAHALGLNQVAVATDLVLDVVFEGGGWDEGDCGGLDGGAVSAPAATVGHWLMEPLESPISEYAN